MPLNTFHLEWFKCIFDDFLFSIMAMSIIARAAQERFRYI